MIVETPSPTIINARIDESKYGKITAINSPIEIKTPLTCITFIFPNLVISLPPKKRPLAIIIMKELYPKTTNASGTFTISLK